MNYWLFTVMHDQFPALWPKLVEHGLAAQHYPRGWTNVVRNENALRKMNRGDGVIAAFKGHRFAGYGFLKSGFDRGGPSLAIQSGEGKLKFGERADIDWMALDPGGEAPYIKAQYLKERGFDVDLTRGLCVKPIDRNTFEKLRQLLDEAGAKSMTNVHNREKSGKSGRLDPQTRERAVWLCLGDPQYLLELERAARRKRNGLWWTVTKSARRGDYLLFYMVSPMSAFVATGIASSDARVDDDRSSEWVSTLFS